MERIEDPANCGSKLQRLMNGNLSPKEISEITMVHPISIEDRLAYFPPPSARQVPNIREGLSAPFSYIFYRNQKSERGWDFALVITKKGVPVGVYYNRGKVISAYGMVVPSDIVFDFYQNPLNHHEEGFDLENLKLYISRSLAVCTNEMRARLDGEFKERSKQQKPQNKKGQIPDIYMQKRSQVPKQQKFMRQKIVG